MKNIALAITGASGVQYGVRLLQCLLSAGAHVQLMISDAAFEVMEIETDIRWPRDHQLLAKRGSNESINN